jgi:hypothetical protein
MSKPKIHVFVSYSRLDNPLFESLKMHLKNCNDIILKTDVHDIKAGELVHKKIAEIIDWTHIVIPIVTKNWLNSHETRDELIRANERRKYIISLVEKGVINDKKLPLPHYLLDDNQIRFDVAAFSDSIKLVLQGILEYKPVEWK